MIVVYVMSVSNVCFCSQFLLMRIVVFLEGEDMIGKTRQPYKLQNMLVNYMQMFLRVLKNLSIYRLSLFQHICSLAGSIGAYAAVIPLFVKKFMAYGI